MSNRNSLRWPKTTAYIHKVSHKFVPEFSVQLEIYIKYVYSLVCKIQIHIFSQIKSETTYRVSTCSGRFRHWHRNIAFPRFLSGPFTVQQRSRRHPFTESTEGRARAWARFVAGAFRAQGEEVRRQEEDQPPDVHTLVGGSAKGRAPYTILCVSYHLIIRIIITSCC